MGNVLDELQDSLKPDEGSSSLETLATEKTLSDDSAELRAKYEELERNNKKLYARAKTAEETLKQTRSLDSLSQGQDFDMEEIIDLRVQGYSSSEIQKLKKLAITEKKLSLHEVVQDDFSKAVIETMRARQQSESATPSPSHRASVEKTPSEEFSKLPKEARFQAFNKALEESSKRRLRMSG